MYLPFEHPTVLFIKFQSLETGPDWHAIDGSSLNTKYHCQR